MILQTIKELENIVGSYAEKLNQLSNQEVSSKKSPTAWSKKEILGHLIDSAQNNLRWFIVAQYEDKPHIKYDQNFWVMASGYHQRPYKDLLDLWLLTNKHILAVLKNIGPGKEKREVFTLEFHNIEWLAADYKIHVLLHHLHQILDLKPVNYP